MIKFYFSLMIFVFSMIGVANAASCGGEISLTKEQTKKTITGSITGTQICEYSFYGKKGQILSLSVGLHDRPRAFLFLPIEKTLANNDPYTLPKNGKYILRVALSPQDMQKFSTPQPFTLQFSLITKEKKNNSLTGKFGAIVPCNQCTGIETRLNIFDNGTYSLHEKYLGVGANSSLSQTGKWSVNGKVIHLNPNDPNKNDRFLFYKNGAMYWIAPFEAKNTNPILRADYRLLRQ